MPPWFIYHLPKGLRPPTQIVNYHYNNSLIGCWKMRKAGQDFWKFSTQVKSFDEFVCGKWEILMVVIFCHHKIGHSQILKSMGNCCPRYCWQRLFLYSASVPRPPLPPVWLKDLQWTPRVWMLQFVSSALKTKLHRFFCQSLNLCLALSLSPIQPNAIWGDANFKGRDLHFIPKTKIEQTSNLTERSSENLWQIRIPSWMKHRRQ